MLGCIPSFYKFLRGEIMLTFIAQGLVWLCILFAVLMHVFIPIAWKKMNLGLKDFLNFMAKDIARRIPTSAFYRFSYHSITGVIFWSILGLLSVWYVYVYASKAYFITYLIVNIPLMYDYVILYKKADYYLKHPDLL